MGAARPRSRDELGSGEFFVRRANGASGDAELGGQVEPGWQTRSRRQHTAFDGGRDALADLLGQRRLPGPIELQFQRLSHTLLGTRFLSLLGTFL